MLRLTPIKSTLASTTSAADKLADGEPFAREANAVAERQPVNGTTATDEEDLMTTRMLAGITVFAAMAVLQVTPAIADAKIFHPAICNAATPESHNKPIYRGTGALSYFGTGTVQITCGLTRDNTLNTNGLAGFKVRIYNQVVCSLTSVGTNGMALQSITKYGQPNAGFQILDWGASLNTSVNGGMYVLSCDLYYDSALYWLSMNEY